MHEAMLQCNKDSSIKSDWMSAPDISDAKNLAKQNYQEKYNQIKNWRDAYHTFDALLAASTFQTK